MPGNGPCGPSICAVSPMTKISAWPGTVRSGFTATRPARLGATPSQNAVGHAATPAAQIKVWLSMRSPPTVTPRSSQAVSSAPSRNSTPSRRSAAAATWDRRGGKLGRTRSPASISTIRAVAGSMRRKSRARPPSNSAHLGLHRVEQRRPRNRVGAVRDAMIRAASFRAERRRGKGVGIDARSTRR